MLLMLCYIQCANPGFSAVSPGLSIVAGNGQVVPQFFNTTVPLTVQARDASGRPVPNLALTWTVTQGQGTVPSPPAATDAAGMASAYFNGNVLPGYSFSQQTVTVSSALGSVNFILTTVINRLPNGSIAELPLVQLLNPPPENRVLSGRSGAVLPGAITVQVADQSGPQTGVAIPNVGFRIVDYNDPTLPPPAQCANQPMTDAAGMASCDLVLTAGPGSYSISAAVGEFRIMPGILLTIGSGPACSFVLTATPQQFGAAGANGTAIVNAANGCTWTATSNSSWITVPASAASGSGYGGTGFMVAPNSGPARSGSISAGGQTITITQAGAAPNGGQALSIVTPANLPSAVAGTAYNAALTASGGHLPYNWIALASPPAGFTLNPSTGAVTGTPSTTGTFSLPVSVTDQAGITQTATFSITVLAAGGQPGGTVPAITNTGFPDATVGLAYQQVLTSVGGCAGPFSAPPVYTISGGALPAGLSIKALDDRRYAIAGTPSGTGPGNFNLTVTDSCGHSATVNFTINVTGVGTGTGVPAGQLTASPPSLTFTLATGAGGNPVDQILTVSGPAGATFAASVSGGNWLSLIGSATGTLPAALTLRVANAGLFGVGSYPGWISITSAVGSLFIPVTLSISTPPVTLVPSPGAINSAVEVGSPVQQQSVTVSTPAGSAHFALLVSTVNGGSWLTVNSLGGDTPANLTVTLNPAGLQPSVYTGSIQLVPTTASAAPLVIPVTLRVMSAPTLAASAQALSFVNQPGQPPPVPQLITVASTGIPVDSTAAATTTSGDSWLFVSPDQGSTPLTVNVRVNAAGLQPGTYQGAVVVTSKTPAVAPISIPVTFTVQQAAPVLKAVLNAASFQSGPVSPGEIITLFGSSIGPASLAGSHVNSLGVLDAALGGTLVYFDDVAAPLIYALDGQVSAIVPYEVAGKTVTRVLVVYRGVSSSPVDVPVVASAPAFFTWSASGQGPAAALNEDGSSNLQTSGATPNSIVVFYATGEGQTNPGGVDGLLATSPFPSPLLPVRVSIGGQDAEVLYAGAAPGLTAGLMQINVRLPANLPAASAVPIVLTVGDAASQPGITIFTQ